MKASSISLMAGEKAISTPPSFPAEDYIREFRAAGGTIHMSDGAVQELWGVTGAHLVRHKYLYGQYAAHDYPERGHAVLEAELVAAA